MNNIDTRNLTPVDAIPADRDEGDFCVAFVVNHKTSSLRFLTGRFAPENLAGQMVWFPIYGDSIFTVQEVYKRQGMNLIEKDWSPGQPYFNNINELGYFDAETETRTSRETMMAMTATAEWIED